MKAMHLIAVPVGIALLLLAVPLACTEPERPAYVITKVFPYAGVDPHKYWAHEPSTGPWSRLHLADSYTYQAGMRVWRGKQNIYIGERFAECPPEAAEAEVANAGMTYRDSVLAYLHASLSLSKTTLGTAGSVVDQQDP